MKFYCYELPSELEARGLEHLLEEVGYDCYSYNRRLIVGLKPWLSSLIPFTLLREADTWLEAVRISRQCILDDLHDAHMALEGSTDEHRESAIENWKRTRERQVEALVEYHQARQDERAATAELVRAHGRVGITIDGELMYPSYNAKGVYLTPQKRRQFTDRERQAERIKERLKDKGLL